MLSVMCACERACVCVGGTGVNEKFVHFLNLDLFLQWKIAKYRVIYMHIYNLQQSMLSYLLLMMFGSSTVIGEFITFCSRTFSLFLRT